MDTIPRVVVYLEDQIDDILRDCCSAESKSILSIDTTFNVVSFYSVLKARRDIQRAVLGKDRKSVV